jgi:very-short-patch-repair endonuclease
MTKLEFIARQLAKAQNKRYEHYVVHRIWNLLKDSRVKFVTQQFVTRPEGRAMTDMFFPQLEIHIEVDEGFHKNQIDADKLREADIINATGHQILRVDVTKDIEEIHQDIDQIVTIIKNKVDSLENFKPWDLDMEQNPQTYIDKGYIDIKDDAAFRTIADAASCFGRQYKGVQATYLHHPVEARKRLSFPKFYPNNEWDNQLSDDEEVITEISKDPKKLHEHIDRVLAENLLSRIVFARVKSPLGDTMYRFKGEYKLDLEATNYETGLVWKRIATRVRTYPNKKANQLSGEEKKVSDIEEFYQQNIVQMSAKNRLKLAAMIIEEISRK